jgi:hypothetical protein
MVIVIPPELVSLVRDGLFFDLHGQVEDAGALIEPRGREDIRAAVDGCFARANGARALLDVVGWFEPVESPSALEVDAHRHREALMRALGTRVEVEHDTQKDPEASAGQRAQAKVRAGQLADLIARTEEDRMSTVTIPGRLWVWCARGCSACWGRSRKISGPACGSRPAKKPPGGMWSPSGVRTPRGRCLT